MKYSKIRQNISPTKNKLTHVKIIPMANICTRSRLQENSFKVFIQLIFFFFHSQAIQYKREFN